ncbi:paired amphipathic helix protein Sin3a [Maniola hyperantus]|uniref:paired amphipathic helix protein Sin3a n=1 Tax=Aphantopus hyperantus TaxID=2795564 RepID=UPI00374980FA
MLECDGRLSTMMKRSGPRLGPDEQSPLPPNPAQVHQPGSSSMHTLAQQSTQPQMLGATAMMSVGGGFGRGPARAGTPAVINYLKSNAVPYAPKQPPNVPPRLKIVSQPPLPMQGSQSPGLAAPLPAPPPGQFQRLKVEDALSYLDQVKYKFNTMPQVYNDFLDIMKEFKSQTIDTPGVITRVSNLFQGHPELIVGFNTFLPPGYKIEVQSNGQVSVSMPSPTGPGGMGGVGGMGAGVGGGVMMGVHHPSPQSQLVHLLPVPPSVSTAIVHNLSVNAPPANTLHHISQAHQQIEAAAIHHPPGSVPSTGGGHTATAGQPVEFNHAIEYVNKIKSRFSRQPDKYKRFLEILHAYQRGHRDVKEPQAKQQTEQEVYSQVAKLFENQDDLLAEFGQFLPDAKAVTKPTHMPHSRSPPPQPRVERESETERFPSASPPQVPLVSHTAHSAPAPHSIHHHPQVAIPTPWTTTTHDPNIIDSPVWRESETERFPSASPPQVPLVSHTAHSAPAPHSIHHHPQVSLSHKKERGFTCETAPCGERARRNASPALRPHRCRSCRTRRTRPPLRTLYIINPQPRVERESETERFPSASPPQVPLVSHTAHSAPAPHSIHHHPQQVSKHTSTSVQPPQHHHLKRSPSFGSSTQIAASGAPPIKKPRSAVVPSPAPIQPPPALRDVSYADAAKLATAHDYKFFDKARKELRPQHVYDNFLRCLMLFTNEIISSSELLCVTSPFLCRHPELQKWLQDFVGPVSPPHTPTNTHPGYNSFVSTVSAAPVLSTERSRLGTGTSTVGTGEARYEPLPPMAAQLRYDRPTGDTAMDIDLTTCKRLGTSYCALPRDAAARRCSGRTPLCKEVLNDTWVSIPTWSEDSTFVTSRKTQYEEYIYRCEDERFELDVVIETNAATIRVLEGVQKKLSRMTAEDAAKYRLDECLGGHSPTIHQRALRRIYGDKAVDIIAGLKKNPVVAVPVVLRRLKAKEEEWREAQKGFNKQWREQNEKYYLKSLDHQGINFKQNDLKALRSKCLFNEVESAYAARRPGPHLVADYGLRTRHEAIKIVRDAAELLIHHARRQTGIQKAEKRRIKQLLRHFLPDLFAHPRQPLSDDERDEEEKEEATSPGSPSADQPADDKGSVKQEKQESSESDNASDKSSRNNKNDKENKPKNNNNTDSKESANSIKRSSSNEDSVSIKLEARSDQDLEEDFRDHPPNEARFVCTDSWYLFLRLHAILCQRLGAARRAALALARAEACDKQRPASVAAALRLKPNNLPADASSPAEYYNALLELVKGVLDGNVEANAYEDAAREMLGIKAYPAYTLDKLVSIAVRQLQRCVSESWSVRAAEMAARGGMRGPASYVRRALRALSHYTTFLVKLYGGDEVKTTFELLEAAAEGRTSPHNDSRLSPTNQSRTRETNGETVSRLAAWSLYTEQYARPDVTQPPPRNKPVFLRRNVRRAGAVAGASTATTPAESTPIVRRRKPPRLHDHSECTLANSIRLVACRPQQLYRPGCLASARASHPRLSAARQTRFRAWLARSPHRT